MVKKIILPLFLGISVSANSQWYIGAGFNLGFPKIDSLNYIIDRYNETRTWLDNELDQIKYTKGLVISTGGVVEGMLFDINWVGRNKTVIAEGIQPINSQPAQRELKFKMNTITFGYGMTIGSPNIGLGLTTDIGIIKVLTRVSDPATIKDLEFEQILNQWSVGSTIYLQLILADMSNAGIGIILRPYYQFPWFLTDFVDVNNAINPATSWNDPWQINSRASSFGVQLIAILHGVNW